MNDLWLFAASVCLGYAGAFFMLKFGGALGFVDIPNKRSSHDTVVPKAGAVGIFLAFLLAGLNLKLAAHFLVSVTLVSFIGLLSDKYDIPSVVRLVLQFFCAGIFLFGKAMPFQSLPSGLWIPIAMIFIVGTTNFYNFMDGIDGIAALTSIIAFGFIGYYAIIYSDNFTAGLLSACISLACLGFLPLNFPKAKIFMGDVGSIMLGFVFAGLVVVLSKSFLDLICITAFIFPFYADELVTMFVRIGKRKDLMKPHRRHLYQILVNQRRVPHWKVSVVYGIIQVVVGISVLLLRPLGLSFVVSALTFYFCAFIWANLICRRDSSKKVPAEI